jgi:hypothetical protein
MNKKILSTWVTLDLHFQIQSIPGSQLKGYAQLLSSCLQMADMEAPMRTLNRQILMAPSLVSCIFQEDLTHQPQRLYTCHKSAVFPIVELI